MPSWTVRSPPTDGRIALRGPALAMRTLSPTGSQPSGSARPLSPKTFTSIALDTPNALIPVGTPNGLAIVGTVASGLISGKVEISFPASVVIPTLPDPYAARYVPSRREEQLVGVGAIVAWSVVDPVSPPELSFEFINTATANAVGRPGARRNRRHPTMLIAQGAS